MKKLENVKSVKGVEYKVNGNFVEFEKNGELVKVERRLGISDYSLVYLELNRKNEKKKNGVKKLGNNYYYEVIENELIVKDKNDEVIGSRKLNGNEKYLRLVGMDIILND